MIPYRIIFAALALSMIAALAGPTQLRIAGALTVGVVIPILAGWALIPRIERSHFGTMPTGTAVDTDISAVDHADLLSPVPPEERPILAPPPDIDLDTGELLGDRVCRIEEVLTGMERTIEQLGNLIGEQSILMANGLQDIRRRVDNLEPEPHQQTLPLREAS